MRRRTLALIAALALSACAEAGPLGQSAENPTGPTRLHLAIEASPTINPDITGRPSPVELRIYELAAAEPFSEAAFLPLFEQDAETLGTTLLARDSVVVLPGSQTALDRELQDGTGAIGVLAVFRDYQEASWRALGPVMPHVGNAFTLTVDRLGIALAAGPPAEAPPAGTAEPAPAAPAEPPSAAPAEPPLAAPAAVSPAPRSLPMAFPTDAAPAA